MVAREQAVHRLFGFVVFPGGRARPRLAIEAAHRRRGIQGSSVRPPADILGFDHWGASSLLRRH